MWRKKQVIKNVPFRKGIKRKHPVWVAGLSTYYEMYGLKGGEAEGWAPVSEW